MQDLPFFCVDITKYGKEVNFSPAIGRADLPPLIAPVYGPLKENLIPIVRSSHVKHLKERLPFIYEQMAAFLSHSYNDPNVTYTSSIANGFIQQLLAVFTLSSWFGFTFEEMRKGDMIHKVCRHHTAEVQCRNITLVMPRLAPIARLRMKKYRRIVDSYVTPALKRDVPPEGEWKSLIDLVKEDDKDPMNSEEMLDTMVSFIPGAMSIVPTVEHIVTRFLQNPRALSNVVDEQLALHERHGHMIDRSVLSEMKMLDAAFKETLRLEFTLASYRYVLEDLVLHDKVLLPAGSHVILTGAAVNYDEVNFPNSHTWDPDRWIEIAEAQKGLKANDARRKDAFIWGSGVVFCPGRSHALVGMKLAAAFITRFFEIRFRHGDDQKMDFKRRSGVHWD